MWAQISKYFFNGLIALLPLFITIWLLLLLFSLTDSILGNLIAYAIGVRVPGLGLLASICLIILAGYLTSQVFGKRLLQFGDRLLYKLPLVSTIYASVKEINDILFLQKETQAFKRVCAVEWPRKGAYAIAFVTAEGVEEIRDKNKKKYYNVFVPNTPSPATGFVTVVPEDEIIFLDMRLEDAIKLIVSGGVLTPPLKK